MDQNVINHFCSGDYEIFSFDSYHHDETVKKISQLDNNHVNHLIAFSLGVYMASFLLENSNLNFKTSTAINGTLKPYDENYGISPDIFDKTIENWSIAGKNSFNKRMIKFDHLLGKYLSIQPSRSLEDQKSELIYIRNLIKNHPAPRNIFSLALVGDQDRIFPAMNQIEFWDSCSRHKIIESPHFPFFSFKNFTQLMEFIKNC